ncbi:MULTISPECIES: TraR/DksA C4-type zinc finger protein [Streptomyces]|uniref:TraR/DksA C4-type zinc finger protein n=1 Tax=Streptomyces glycanivorans TaxID=3033808 RepID=A0ABY9JM23_9ACTN|nr:MULTISPECIES: TraR/DksA C4-type zinc finger protein [unclassified Streptomyces]WSQ80483.1 TraR/DksA C4-type zinc finger protein [Streptomyces sp. NBC_01213]WLQ67062.1 TraR/DksA C4-type zinc finger protein [Streptomyces sp. Alt3]WSQ87815.1 TraR/DksA C4-type zinc finger protein [Streptomyces sp. NBC_01212]WSR06177.1 TraR/DksA C4-type zinc finger protein [Streptomyces sp. NBC_01208]WSR51216.1 TraR/DksA C4-type zinc finger protein [Streptomyces sp. NBC_01201]
MVTKKTAVPGTASEGSTAAAAEKETAGTGGKDAEGPGEEKPARKAARKKAASHPREPEQAGQDPAHGGPAKKSAKKSTAKKSAAKKASKKATGAAQAAEQTGAHTVVAKKSAARTTAAGEGTATAVPPAGGGVATAPADLAVRPGEDPWTPEEVEEARTELTGEVLRLRSELEASGEALAGLMRDSGDGAGDDDADTGTKNITREHELSLAAHAQETLDQTERALARLDAGTYGLCEVCGKPIGKARMQAFPRATLCVEDKQRQERRG